MNTRISQEARDCMTHEEAIAVLKKEREDLRNDVENLKLKIALKQLKINALTYTLAATELYMVNIIGR